MMGLGQQGSYGCHFLASDFDGVFQIARKKWYIKIEMRLGSLVGWLSSMKGNGNIITCHWHWKVSGRQVRYWTVRCLWLEFSHCKWLTVVCFLLEQNISPAICKTCILDFQRISLDSLCLRFVVNVHLNKLIYPQTFCS